MDPPSAVAATPLRQGDPSAGAETNTIRPRRTHPRGLFVKRHEKRTAVPRSAWELLEAGIRFVRSETRCLDDIHFSGGTLGMPWVELDDDTAYKLHNMMAFEAMHAGTGNDVTAYVLFVKDLIDSADDVRLLVRKKILEHDDAGRGQDLQRAHQGRDQVRGQRAVPRVGRRGNPLRQQPGARLVLQVDWLLQKGLLTQPLDAPLALITAIVLLVATVVQAVYAVLSYDPNKD